MKSDHSGATTAPLPAGSVPFGRSVAAAGWQRRGAGALPSEIWSHDDRPLETRAGDFVAPFDGRQCGAAQYSGVGRDGRCEQLGTFVDAGWCAMVGAGVVVDEHAYAVSVPVATLDDMKLFYRSLDLGSAGLRVHLLAGCAAPVLLAMFFAAAIDQQLEEFRSRMRRGAGMAESHGIRATTLRSLHGAMRVRPGSGCGGDGQPLFSSGLALRCAADVDEWLFENEVGHFRASLAAPCHANSLPDDERIVTSAPNAVPWRQLADVMAEPRRCFGASASTVPDAARHEARTASFTVRHHNEAPYWLARLREAVACGGNLFEELIDAVRYCTLGQIFGTLVEADRLSGSSG